MAYLRYGKNMTAEQQLLRKALLLHAKENRVEFGEMLVCQCGRTFKNDRFSFKSTITGQYFCSTTCAERFKNSPCLTKRVTDERSNTPRHLQPSADAPAEAERKIDEDGGHIR